jgi:hypothetical protein
MNLSTLNLPGHACLPGMRKSLALLSAAFIFAIGPITVRATLIAYDSFNYPSGGQINVTTAAPTGTPTTTTDGGWTGNWGGGAASVNSFGLTYPNLPTGHLSMASLGANDIYTHIASTPTVGSVWVSFLMVQNGDNGGNRSGVILENSSGTGIMFSYQQNSGSQGYPCLVAMSGTTSTGTQLGDSANLQTYANTNFYVLQFTYSGGVVSSISVYSNPTAGQNVAPAPDFTVSSGLPNFGALVNFGLVDGSAIGITLDEFRVGTTFGDVVGAVTTVPTVPTTLSLSVAPGDQVSWTANSTDSYQPQSSSDDINWNNLGGILVGSAVSSVYDPTPAAFYQILDYTVGGISNAEPNGSFEIPDVNSTGALDWSGPANGVDGNGNTIDVYATNSWGGTVNPVNGTNLLYIESTTPASGPVTPPNVYLDSALFPIPAGGVTYPLSFSSANPVTVGGANPQYQIEFWDSSQAFISATAFFSVGAGSTWTTITNNIAAPANAAYMSINFIQAMGAGNGWDWVTLIDNIQVDYNLPGPTNVLTPTVQSGAVFTATIQTNGVTATAATGNVTFFTNTVAQSVGGVVSGIANSSPAIVPASYTLTAIYSGDGTYLGSTNTLVIGGNVSTVSTNIVTTISGNQFRLSWPTDHTGWTLQANTNSLKAGTWFNVPGSTATNVMVITVNPAYPAVFYRLEYTP